MIVLATTDAQYLYVVDVSYSFESYQISRCQADLTAKLKQAIPNQTINTCVFDGGKQNMHFSVTGVEYPNPGIQTVSLYGWVCVRLCCNGHVCGHTWHWCTMGTCKIFCVGMYLLAYPALGYVGMCKILYVGMCLLVCPALGYCECSS